MRSEPSSAAITDMGVVGCWTKSENDDKEHQQTKLIRDNDVVDGSLQDQETLDNESKKDEENLNLRSRSKRRRPVASVTPDLELTDSSSISDDITYVPYSSRSARSRSGGSSTSSGNTHISSTRSRRKPVLNARERNIRRLESNERERMRMHSLNDAFQVKPVTATPELLNDPTRVCPVLPDLLSKALLDLLVIKRSKPSQHILECVAPTLSSPKSMASGPHQKMWFLERQAVFEKSCPVISVGKKTPRTPTIMKATSGSGN